MGVSTLLSKIIQLYFYVEGNPESKQLTKD